MSDQVDLPALLRAHDARVTELLEANSREVERRRAAEARVAELEVELHRMRKSPFYVPGKPLGRGQFEADLYDPRRERLEAALGEDRTEWDAWPRW